MNLRVFFASLMALAATAALAHAATAEAQAKLQGAVNQVLAVANKSGSKAAIATSVRPLLQRYISFETMTRRAVGPGWNSFNAAQKSQATQLFTTLVIRTYSNKFTPGQTPQIQYRAATEPASGRVDVPTTVVYQGNRYTVTYRMEQPGWLITDVVIEGVSMIANYRTQLDSVFKKGGADAVIKSLEQSVSKQP
ncbi:MAG: phospholipid-binding protein MlaC [Prosthecobacter sp.]